MLLVVEYLAVCRPGARESSGAPIRILVASQYRYLPSGAYGSEPRRIATLLGIHLHGNPPRHPRNVDDGSKAIGPIRHD